MENKRRKQHTNLETVQVGFANGVSPNFPLTSKEKEKMIKKAANAYGKFLDALDCDWRNDPNSMETPMRVAKAYVNDLWEGRYTAMSEVTSFPSDGYDGVIIERNIPLTSMCSHHHQTIEGVVHIGYVSGKEGELVSDLMVKGEKYMSQIGYCHIERNEDSPIGYDIKILSYYPGDERGCLVFNNTFICSGHDGSYLWDINNPTQFVSNTY